MTGGVGILSGGIGGVAGRGILRLGTSEGRGADWCRGSVIGRGAVPLSILEYSCDGWCWYSSSESGSGSRVRENSVGAVVRRASGIGNDWNRV